MTPERSPDSFPANVALGQSSHPNATLAQKAAVARLRAAGVASPEHDARALLAHVLDIPWGRLVTVDELTPEQRARYEHLVDERADRVPLQHLTGVAGFRRLELAVGPGVFVPRPETESLVEWGLEQLRGHERPVVVDLCAGSGAIALSVADELPGATVYAVEREADAYAWALRNAAGTDVRIVHADIAGVLPELAGTVDLVLANPPYIPDGARIEREVAEHDPPAALWGGSDGLDTVRVVIATAARLLRSGGRVGIEHADLQGESVPALLRRVGGWHEVSDHRDLAERPRFATGTRATRAVEDEGVAR
ncbi:MAG TPA: peptide chain release factor N(5)-glutamine methyltransferase [Mycobacteriales bacterium]|jgi:release factor glutamine methyltransferase|nr:peptide chain release factor N(5)-glutamine methyltransferase [Mycobacteriales bacterium]